MSISLYRCFSGCYNLKSITKDGLHFTDLGHKFEAGALFKEIVPRVIEVDKFADEKILGVICDESWLQIYDNLFKMDEEYNGRVMATNFYLHAWGTYAISPFANAVALVTEDAPAGGGGTSGGGTSGGEGQQPAPGEGQGQESGGTV